jgi:thiosulfate/3-mercaptopyruvate sulfurtransferase
MDEIGPKGEGTVKWVSTQWLAEHLRDEDLQILDVQPDVHDYFMEHIPGARYMNQGLLRVPLQGMPAMYAPAEAIQANVRRVGLDLDVPVVVYTGVGPFKGWGDGLEQTMMAYSLARFGHRNLYVLDGGVEKWKAEGRPLDQKFPDVDESDWSVDVQRDYFIDYDQLVAMKDREDVILLDARPPEFYQGQGPWIKPGHIPGAVNLPWKTLMDPDNTRLLKPDSEIEQILDKHGVNPDKTVICSCGTGREATNEFLLFKFYLGYPNVKLYEGSFTEWSSYPDNPIVTGPNPR